MAKRRITSKPGLFGYVYHYDEQGKCIGKSRPSLMGNGKVHYDASGKQVGTSRPGFFAKEVYHDREKERYLSAYEGLTGDVYFEDGMPVGTSHQGFCGAQYTLLDEDDVMGEYDSEDEYIDDDPQERFEYNERFGNNTIRNLIVLGICCVIGAVLVLISLIK